MPDPSSSPLAEAHPWLRHLGEGGLALALAIWGFLKRAKIGEALKAAFAANGGGGGRDRVPASAGGGDPLSLSKLSRLEAMEEIDREERRENRLVEKLLEKIQRMADANREANAAALRPLLESITAQTAAMTALAERFDAAQAARAAEVITLRELVAEGRGLIADAHTAREEITARVEQIQKLAETLASIYQELGKLPDFPTMTGGS